MPSMVPKAIGYGAGDRDFKGFSNVLRVWAGETVDTAPSVDSPKEPRVAVIEATIDDMNPQVYGYFQEKALQEGALDVYLTAVQMKKNRPGHCLTIIADPAKLDRLTALVFQETTTIGVRIHEVQRRTLDRVSEMVETRYGKVRVKVARLNGTILNLMPEFEDCRRIAEEQSIPLKDVLAEAMGKVQGLKT